MKNNLILIGTGFLGSYLIQELKSRNFQLINTYFSKNQNKGEYLDIRNLQEIRNFFAKHEPDIIINTAGRTDIDYLEKNPNEAISVNTMGPKNIATITEEMGIKLVHVSTDSIFDGVKGNYNENDKPNPVNIYAKSKLDAELSIKQITKKCVIIRTNFYGMNQNSKHLFNSIFAKLKNGEEFVGFNDIIFSPLEIKNLSQLICDVVDSNYSGILHLASNEKLSKYEFCTEIAKTFGFDKSLIINDSIKKMKFVAKRPNNTSLDNSKSKSIIRHNIISFNDWLLTLNTKGIK